MTSLLATLLRIVAFPLLFGGAGIAAWAYYTPDIVTWLMPLIVTVVVTLTLGLERLVPFADAWNSVEGAGEDVYYIGVTASVVALAEAAIWALIVTSLGPLDVRAAAIWPDSWPIMAQVFLALVIGDFLPYVYHRASHRSSGWLWRVHAVHHAPARLYALNFARFHPLNAALTAALTLLPLALLGAPPLVLFVAGVLHNVHGVLSHSNVDFRLGWLNAIFSMAELHRWHHAHDAQQASGNYGATVLLWDWLFRTRRQPGRQVAADGVGLWQGSELPPRWIDQWLYPFAGMASRWRLALRTAAQRYCSCCCTS
ncbi:MAG: sterol desaturase family protein [Rhodanobacteraceae bacterium]|nr:sterol desaturase family protein [Rhodanobacteraceae bacterium]